MAKCDRISYRTKNNVFGTIGNPIEHDPADVTVPLSGSGFGKK